ncbi:MAG TPA: FHA domain-containing protein [Thermoanaerobaculia bacterium]|nr:FHA domain-containing protein [Thermoanaerobaculia bacterium]
MSSDFLAAGEPALTFKFDEFTFNTASHVLLRGNTERHLSPKAHTLLRLLLIARPRALSREELYDAIWPSTFVCETNLASIVNQLRRALGDDARTGQHIRTIHGFGYAFCGEVSISAERSSGDSPTYPMLSSVAAMLSCDGVAYALHEGENLIGRALDSRVVLTDKSVSRRHAMITVSDGVISIKDLDSTNGTYIEGQRVFGSLVPNGARIWFGTVEATITSRRVSTTNSVQLDMSELQRQVAERMANA